MRIEKYGIYLTKNEFDELEDFEPVSDVEPQESILKIIFVDGKKKLLKFHRTSRKDYIVSKNFHTIMSYKDVLLTAIPNLVLPEIYAHVEGLENVAYIMPLMSECFCLQDLLRYSQFPNEKKLKLLKMVDDILAKYDDIKDFPYNMYGGDVHEGNFLVDVINGKIFLWVVDTISCYIDGNGALDSKYLELNNEIERMCDEKIKYRKNGLVIPDKNTDIFCYVFMILNSLAQMEMSVQSKSTILNYADYLSSIGFDKMLLDSVERIFDSEDNINPKDFLMNISEEQFDNAHYLVYKKKTGVNLSRPVVTIN